MNPEEENICLPLVINVISKYWGEEISLVDAEQIAKKYSGIKGSIMIEGIELAEKQGLKGYVYRGSVEDIKRKIDQGIPSIVILPGIHETVQHANIICGFCFSMICFISSGTKTMLIISSCSQSL